MTQIEKIVLFHNPTDEDFTGQWDKIEEVIKAGASRHMELWRAKHYAKHLIDRELNKRNIVTNNQIERDALFATIVIDEEVIEVPSQNVASEIVNIEKKKTAKKTTKTVKKVTSDEETFEGLE